MMMCKCTLAQKTVGDGCEVCQPETALQYAKETIEEQEAELSRYRAFVDELKRRIQEQRVYGTTNPPKQVWKDKPFWLVAAELNNMLHDHIGEHQTDGLDAAAFDATKEVTRLTERNAELADNAADLLAAKIRLEAECERLKGMDRPQYSVCNDHPHITAVHRMATYECPACRADQLQAKLDELTKGDSRND